MTTTMISLIHQAELDTLKVFVKVCKQLGLSYIATGGTLLGAIRHHGFIPWDDDLDVAMLRSDYEIFLAKAPDVLASEPYFLQTPFSDENYGLSYAKLLNQHTFIEEKNNFNYARKGVFLDIFPLDQIPDSVPQLRKLISDVHRLDSRLLLKLHYNVIDTPMRHLMPDLSIEQRKTVLELKERRLALMQQYNNGDVWADTRFKNIASQYSYDQEIMTYHQITTTELVPFEDMLLTVSSDYNNILINMYGDYMVLPPESQQAAKHINHLITNNQEYFA